MSIAPVTIDTLPAQFSPSNDAAIAVLAERYMPLKIQGPDDAAGFEEVHTARMAVKKTRLAIEARRKELKEDALKYGKAVDGEAKRLTAQLEPIEGHLQAEEDAYKEAKERKRNAARLAAEEEARKQAEAAAAALKAEQERLATERAAMEAEKKRQQEEAARIAEEHRKAQEAIEQQRRELEEERQRLAWEDAKRQQAAALQKAQADAATAAKDAEARDALAKAEEARRVAVEQQAAAERTAAEQRHAAEIEKARAEAAAQAKRETEERLERLQMEADMAQQDEDEEPPAECEFTDRQKLETVADAIEAIQIPDVAHNLEGVVELIAGYLEEAAAGIRYTIASHYEG